MMDFLRNDSLFLEEFRHNDAISFIQNFLEFLKKDESSNRPFSYSESESKDITRHSVKFSNVHNCDRSSDATRSNLLYQNV